MTTLISITESPTRLAPLTWRVLPATAADEALALWRKLDRQLTNTSVANCATWVECWLDVYSRVVPVRFVIADRDGQPRGIALLASGIGEQFGPVKVRTLHLGTAGEPQPGSVCVEYNRMLVADGDREQFLQAVLREIASDAKWDQLKLDGFSETDLQPWRDQFPQAEVRSRDSKFFNLQAARDAGSEILPRLGSSTRSNLKRRLKKYGDIQVEWATSLEQAQDIFTQLISLHQARWQGIGQPGAFASERFLQFQQRITVKLFLENKLVLFRAMHEGEPIGCLLLLVDQNRLLDYVSGLASFDVKPSPGLVTHYLCMNEALARGYDAYDFLVGDKQHKDNLSDSVNQLCWLTASRPRLKLRAIDFLRKLKRAARPVAAPVTKEEQT